MAFVSEAVWFKHVYTDAVKEEPHSKFKIKEKKNRKQIAYKTKSAFC